MPIIRQLEPETINRIAAGEVIERPASVVKELVENALDAGAGEIEVVTAAGGLSLIRVTDDGAGMSAADLALAVERHATSKLADEDLFNIATLGFRGEALPSIGAIARLSIESRPREARGRRSEIVVDRGSKEAVRPAALNRGTRVEVRELFSATPARLKFLKSERAENLGHLRGGQAPRHGAPRSGLHADHRRARRPQAHRAAARARRPPRPPRPHHGPRVPRRCAARRHRARGRARDGLCRPADAAPARSRPAVPVRQRPPREGPAC